MSASEAIGKMEQYRLASLDPVFFKALKDMVRKPEEKAA
jgi:hypothetical protein